MPKFTFGKMRKLVLTYSLVLAFILVLMGVVNSKSGNNRNQRASLNTGTNNCLLSFDIYFWESIPLGEDGQGDLIWSKQEIQNSFYFPSYFNIFAAQVWNFYPKQSLFCEKISNEPQAGSTRILKSSYGNFLT